MSSTSKFILHRDHERFVPGQSTLNLKSLIYSHTRFSSNPLTSIPVLIFLAVFLSFLTYMAVGIFLNIIWVIFSTQQTSAELTSCNLLTDNPYYDMNITYSYTIDGLAYTGKSAFSTYKSEEDCSDYPLHTTIQINYLKYDYSSSFIRQKDIRTSDSSISAFLISIVMILTVFIICVSLIMDIYRYIRTVWVYQRLKKANTVLDGEIISIRGLKRGQQHTIIVSYKFMSPSNRWIYGIERADRNDLKNVVFSTFPQFVNILYADDYAYTLL